jgi:hypothetical protein
MPQGNRVERTGVDRDIGLQRHDKGHRYSGLLKIGSDIGFA